MGKKKVEVYFRLELVFSDKMKITKPLLKSYLEEKIKGLKVTTYESFSSTKDVYKAEVISNFLSLLHADDIMKEDPKVRSTLAMSLEPKETRDKETPISRLAERMRNLVEWCGDKAKRKIVMDNFDKELDGLENIVMELHDYISRMEKENIHMKGSLDSLQNLQSANVSQIGKSLADSHMDHTATYIQSLQEEKERLLKKSLEHEEMLKMYEKKQGDKVLLEQIKSLENDLKEREESFNIELQESREQYSLLSLEILEKNERIKELETLMKEENKGEVINLKQQLDSTIKKLKALDEKYVELEEESNSSKYLLTVTEESNKNLTGDLARTLEQNRKLQDQINDLTKQIEERTPTPSLSIPSLTVMAKNDSFDETKDTEQIESKAKPANLTAINEYNADLHEKLKQAQAKLSHLTVLLAEKEEEYIKYMDDYRIIQEYFLKTEKELKIAQMQLESSTEEKLKLQHQLATTDAESTSFSIQETEYKTRIEKLEKIIIKRENDRTNLLRQIEERNEIISNNEDKFIDYESNKEMLEKAIESLKNELAVAKGLEPGSSSLESVSDLKLQIEEGNQKVMKLNLKISELQDKLQNSTSGSFSSSKAGRDEFQPSSDITNYEKQTDTKTIADLTQKVKDLQLNNSNLQKLIEMTNSSSTGLYSDIESNENTIKKLTEELAQEKAEQSIRIEELKVKQKMDMDIIAKDKLQLETELKLLKEQNGQLREQYTKCLTEIDSLKMDNIKSRSTTSGTDPATTQKYLEEINTLKSTVLELETQMISKDSGSSESVIGLKKQHLEQRKVLISEQLRIQKELEKQQEISHNLQQQIYDKDLVIMNKETELKLLKDQQQTKQEEIKQIELKLSRKSNEFEILRKNLMEIPQKSHSSGDEQQYISEVIYVYKTLLTSATESFENSSLKLEHLTVLSNIRNSMSDPKMTKDKLRTIVVNALPNFPYLTKFDLKTDYKFLVMGILKIVEHKLLKHDNYEAERDRSKIMINCAEEKIRIYSNKLTT